MALPSETTVAKINISLPDELLDEVDDLASELSESRSGFVREATTHYVAHVQAEREARERAERIDGAMRAAREIAERLPAGGPSAEELVRRDRDSDYGNADDE
jgi:metal-responsive CopG/Arc/MetJ family transcriptional regulator